jgi:raffinose/stachyose/melibiose transport system substrate-binding protein
MNRSLAGFALAGVMVVAAACSAPGGTAESSEPAPASSAPAASAAASADATDSGPQPVTTEEVAALGDVTLDVWADGGEETTMAAFIPMFEAAYPNVKVNLTLKGFDDLMSTVVPALAGDTPPDIAQGNQGYGVDGLLVAGGLISPLDDVATAYGWGDAYNPADFGQFSWTEGATNFGSGTLYGMSPVTEMVGVFYNKKKLADLGLEVPTNHEELVTSLEAAKAAGELPIMMGNSDKYPASHVFGLVQGAYTPGAETRDWISGTPGSTFNSPTNVQSLDELKAWVDAGYFPKGFDGISADDAVAKFGAGEGLYLMGGTWNAGALQETLGEDVGFLANPPGASGASTGTGSLGLGWHLSSKSDATAAATAFMGMLMSPDFAQNLADLNRLPASKSTVTGTNPLFTDLVAAAQTVLGDGGQTYYFDWATDTMYDTFTGGLQEFMAGKISAQEFIDAVQANWDDFQASRQ